MQNVYRIRCHAGFLYGISSEQNSKPSKQISFIVRGTFYSQINNEWQLQSFSRGNFRQRVSQLKMRKLIYS